MPMLTLRLRAACWLAPLLPSQMSNAGTLAAAPLLGGDPAAPGPPCAGFADGRPRPDTSAAPRFFVVAPCAADAAAASAPVSPPAAPPVSPPAGGISYGSVARAAARAEPAAPPPCAAGTAADCIHAASRSGSPSLKLRALPPPSPPPDTLWPPLAPAPIITPPPESVSLVGRWLLRRFVRPALTAKRSEPRPLDWEVIVTRFWASCIRRTFLAADLRTGVTRKRPQIRSRPGDGVCVDAAALRARGAGAAAVAGLLRESKRGEGGKSGFGPPATLDAAALQKTVPLLLPGVRPHPRLPAASRRRRPRRPQQLRVARRPPPADPLRQRLRRVRGRVRSVR